MIHITQLIYIKKGQEEVFHEFEEMAIPIIARYNGRLNLRIRPKPESIIENNIKIPYEIHLVEFETQNDFEKFKLDEQRKSFLHLKENSIESTILIQGVRLH